MILQREDLQSGQVNVQLRPFVFLQKPYDRGRLELPDDADGAIVRDELLKTPGWKDISPIAAPVKRPDRAADSFDLGFRPVVMKHPDAGKDVKFGTFGVCDESLTPSDEGLVTAKSRDVHDELVKIGFVVIGLAGDPEPGKSKSEQIQEDNELELDSDDATGIKEKTQSEMND